MPIVRDEDVKSARELDGAFRVAGKRTNIWFRFYITRFGNRCRVSMSYFDGEVWRNTPPIWLDEDLLSQLIEKLKRGLKILQGEKVKVEKEGREKEEEFVESYVINEFEEEEDEII